ncbi:MAG: PilZ domain-containing protein [Candidatus Omnitrophota bacterium]
MKDTDKKTDRREYVRLESVFPVEFQFLEKENHGSITDIMQGYTRNISKGGICLEVNTTDLGFEDTLKRKDVDLNIRFHIPISHKETRAFGDIIWYKKIGFGYPAKYLIGFSFKEIDKNEINRIYRNALRMYLMPRIVLALVIFLILGIGYFYAADYRLQAENKRLTQRLVELSTKKSGFEKDIIDIDDKYKDIEEKLSGNESILQEYREKIRELEGETASLKEKEKSALKEDDKETLDRLSEVMLEKERLSEELTSLAEERRSLENRIKELTENRVLAEDALKEFLPSFEVVEGKSMESMYRWIKNHQDKSTGLVISYEGDKDLEDWSFTYDQSLSAQCFILKSDKDRAMSIFDFYKKRAEKAKGAFINAYDASTGFPIEYNVHSGPNVWLGIAILRYTDKFDDTGYLEVAEGIANWLIKLQNQDPDYGIRGGPDFGWFSTEHNLDAYAFFGLLYEVTAKDIYKDAREKTFEWIKDNAYNYKEGRLNRGKGDATIATDTFAWAIASIGPERLKEEGMDPDQIIDFAEENCLVTTEFIRPDGEKISVTGFDFGKHEHLARGGVVSTEWTAQMIVTLNIMAEYHKKREDLKRALVYKRKADFYLSELEKMIIVSLSKIGQGEGCLPYASQDDVDTGHGWRAPKGSRTGSTAGTSYTIFAKNNYNPLMF